uniref:Uncharacterized protein n=1 Tax=Panagrolaimus sp. PS1159 TaxID=55785 RepID=A0AC35GLM1_9BILA
MATKDNFLLFKKKHKSFNYCHTDTGPRYSDLNLNQNLKVSNIFPIQSNSKSYNTKKIDYTLSERYEKKEKSQTWKKSSTTDLCSKYSNNLSLNDENEKCWKKNGSSNATNNSTLFLRISAYENSNEASDDSLNPASKFVSRSPFEFQRQQNDKEPEPEVSKFKAFQRLLNLNKSDLHSNTSMAKPTKEEVLAELEETQKERKGKNF